ncbi:Hypothetical protein A7982_01040 [Minicystis rosea]|nr:Hypothetical protein A7982_01040 [Minicystis rosea]
MPLAASLAAAQADLATATGPVLWALPGGTHTFTEAVSLGRAGVELSIGGIENCTLDLGAPSWRSPAQARRSR